MRTNARKLLTPSVTHSPALETLTLTLGNMMGGLGVTLLAAEDLVARTIVVDLRRLWGVHSCGKGERGEER